jgi:hypothetical protein
MMLESTSMGHIAKISVIVKDPADRIYSILINWPNVELNLLKVFKVTQKGHIKEATSP